MGVLYAFLLSVVVVQGFRIRRSEVADAELAFSDFIPSHKKAESTDGFFDDLDSIIPHDQAEREASDFVRKEINQEYSGDFAERNVLPLKTTPTPLYNFPTQSTVYESPSSPTFQNTLIPRQAQTINTQYPYATTFSPHILNYQSPRSYFPFGYPKSINHHPQSVTPPPNPYIPLLYYPSSHLSR
eukprot:TRINITY_DN21998_c0_g1_i1.p1 TRINITY_DN21998_c0_g1~~TRINITY_DN21998_c0_g1_i1.p1  ORF type:complete len:192 (+),score=27.04 TRINITY_DN21998_c0_g1_i1:24-578(+)